jgi:hypothetical protein
VRGSELWSQGVARRALTGGRSHTMNPTPAARMLLGRSFGKSRVARGKRVLERIRRRFHKDNPAPALLAAASALGGVGKRLKSRAARDAERAANTDAQAAAVLAAPNGSALQDLALQRMEAQQYATSAANQYHAARLAEVRAAIQTAAQEASKVTAVQRRSAAAAAAREAAARGERREERLTQLGGVAAQALLGRGRRPRTRRRRARSFSF